MISHDIKRVLMTMGYVGEGTINLPPEDLPSRLQMGMAEMLPALGTLTGENDY